jgi:hypothetical protein
MTFKMMGPICGISILMRKGWSEFKESVSTCYCVLTENVGASTK